MVAHRISEIEFEMSRTQKNKVRLSIQSPVCYAYVCGLLKSVPSVKSEFRGPLLMSEVS